MNVLVLDDQYDVVQGVLQGVNWASLGVRHAYPAYSVEDACAFLRDQTIHVLLCDIEIPPRSGFEVLSWIQERRLPTQVIFLTAHASFEYAQTAVKMGGFDYLLLPARYEDIEKAVARALSKFQETQQSQREQQYGRYWMEKEELLLDSCLNRFFRGGDGHGLQLLFENLRSLQIPLAEDTAAIPVLVHITGGLEGFDQRNRLRHSLDGHLCQWLASPKRTSLVADMQEDGLLALLCDESADWKDVLAQFRTLLSEYEEQGIALACYVGESVSPQSLHGEYALLRKRKQANVAGYTGVFTPNQKQPSALYVYAFPDMQRWASQLTQGRCQEVLAQALHTLHESRERGHLDAAYLAKFHQDFTQMFFSAVRSYEKNTHNIFYDEYPFADFLDAYTSYEKMVALVRFAVGYIEERMSLPAPLDSPVDQAASFIHEHIEQNLSCVQIAQAVHLNPSHLTRLFKREKGIALNEYIMQEKMRVASSLLKVTSIPVSLVAVKVGYTNFSYFSQVFRKHMGLTPMEYRQQTKDSAGSAPPAP